MGYIVFGDDDRMNAVRARLAAEDCDGIACVFAPNITIGYEEMKRIPWGASVYVAGVIAELSDTVCAKALRVMRYADCDRFSAINARLTAEATLAIILAKIKTQLLDNKILIVGNGRCGSALAEYLKALNADFDIMTARPESAQGNAVNYNAKIDGYDVIVNTAPSRVIADEKLETVKRGVIIIDIASKPYGLDHDIARELGLDCDVYPALPNLYRVEAAADAVCKFVRGDFNE